MANIENQKVKCKRCSRNVEFKEATTLCPKCIEHFDFVFSVMNLQNGKFNKKFRKK